MGCTTPAPKFIGAARSDVAVDGMTFAVFRRADEVEVHRINAVFLPRESDVLLAAEDAIEIATGCRVRARSMRGDQAVITARLICP